MYTFSTTHNGHCQRHLRVIANLIVRICKAAQSEIFGGLMWDDVG